MAKGAMSEGKAVAGGIEVVVGDHHYSLLEAFEEAGFAPEYQCREGLCGVCRTTLLVGEVEYQVKPLANIREQEILTCCCRPKGTITLAEHPPVKQRRA